MRAPFQENPVVFLVHDVIKTFSRTFFPYFFKPQRLKYQLLAFRVSFSRTFSPYFFKPQDLKYQLFISDIPVLKKEKKNGKK